MHEVIGSVAMTVGRPLLIRGLLLALDALGCPVQPVQPAPNDYRRSTAWYERRRRARRLIAEERHHPRIAA